MAIPNMTAALAKLRAAWANRTNTTALLTGVVLFVVLLATYIASPIRISEDSRWSIATTMSFIRGAGGELSAYLPPSPDYAPAGYALRTNGDRTYSMYPIGASLLAVPAVIVRMWIDPAFEAAIRTKVPEGTEKAITSFYGAIAAALLFFVVFIRFNDLRIALATALMFALCTSMWSTATRALWQHGPLILMLVITMLILLAAQRRASLVQYASLPLALSFVIRPTAGIPIAVFTTYVLICYRPWFWRYALWAACIAIPWIAYNVLTWGSILPPYYILLASGTAPAANSTFGEALVGNLFSPARGLFIFSPVLLLAIGGFWLAMRIRDERALHMTFGLVVVLHWLLVSHFSPWWGGYSFGPRIMSDVLPFLAYFVAFTVQWCLARPSRVRLPAIGVIAGLAALSMFIHAQGALRWPPHLWNAFPTDIDTHPARLWDWNDLQFTRW
jgi:hypothetical protein